MEDIEVLELPIDHRNAQEVGNFLAGLLISTLRQEFHRLADGLRAGAAAQGLTITDDEILDQAVEDAFDRVASDFPEPIQSRLLEQKLSFVAAVRQKN